MPLVTSTVYDHAADLLASVVDRMGDVYDDYTPPIVLPERQYVHAGEVAWDCEQVVVTVVDLRHAFPGETAKPLVCSPPRHIHMEVWIVRCVPTLDDNGNPPSPAALDAAAHTELQDLWTLAYVLWKGYSDADWGGTCASVLLGPVDTVGPLGAYAAVKADVYLLVT